MNEHEWTRDQIATCLTNGLEPSERDRLNRHLAECGECAAAWSEAQRMDSELNELFRPVRPTPTLEDSVIRAIRTAPMEARHERRPFPLWGKMLLGAAAAVIVGCMGFVVDAADRGDLNGAMARTAPATNAKYGADAGVEGEWSNGSVVATQGAAGARQETPVLAVDELAQKLNDETRRLAEHAESGDSEDYRQTKGDEKGYVGGENRGRFGSRTTAGGTAAPTNAPPPAKPSDPYMTYKSDAPAPAMRAADNQYFRPGEQTAMVTKELEAKKEKEPVGDPKPDPTRGPDAKKKNQETDKKDQEPPQQQRKIIRNGEMEFEVENFDTAITTITKIVMEENGYIATTNSDKLANGKMRGLVVLRCPPDRLDTLVLKLRGMGDLKSQKITSEDVTKQFYDIESRLKAAKTMEERLLKIIKDGKGEIKDLLAVEKELAEWRTKIEEFEGTMRYLSAQVSLSTLTLTIIEKNIRTAATATERETVTMSLEVEDVEKQHNAALAAITEAKGRVTKADLRKFQADQMLSAITFEVAFDASAPLRARLTLYGNVASLDVDRSTSQTGEGKPTGEVKRDDSRYTLSMYNIANIQPRESTTVSVATNDADKTYKDVLARVSKATGRIVRSHINRQRNDQTTAVVEFEVKAEEAESVKTDILVGLEIMRLTTIENPDVKGTTKSKKGFSVTIFALGAVQPRETAVIQLAAGNVVGGYSTLQEAIQKAGGRVLNATLTEEDKQRVTAYLDFEVRRSELPAVEAAMKAVGDIYTRNAQRAPDQENVVDSKVRWQLTVINAATIPAREKWTLGVEVKDVDAAINSVVVLGRVLESHTAKDATGRITGRVVLNVPLKSAQAVSEKLAGLGDLRIKQASKNETVPDSEVALARFEVTLSNERIIPANEGLGSQFKDGLYRSATLGMASLKWIFIGVFFFLPWALLAWLGWKIVARLTKKPEAKPVASGQ